jgi:hypothetical protein
MGDVDDGVGGVLEIGASEMGESNLWLESFY